MNLRRKNFKEISKKKTGSKVHHLARNPSFLIGHLIKLNLIVMMTIEVMVIDDDHNFKI